jgi:hypothetical protein
MTHPVIAPKKLIEVALPLDDINEASAREKSIRHGHPSTLHLWWARRPLAAARAVIFAQLVNDPASLWEAQHPGETPNKQQKGVFTKRRNELFALIRQLVKWENTTNETVLNKAREEIRKSWKEVCALNKDHPEARRSSIRRRCRGCTTPSRAAGPSPGGAAPRARRLRLGPQPRRGAHQQGDDRDPAEVRGAAAHRSAAPGEKQQDDAEDVARRHGPRGGRPPLRRLDARRGLQAHRAPVPAGRDHRGDGDQSGRI